MKKTILWGTLALLAAALVAGCTNSGTSDASRIRGRYGQLARAVERENIGDVMSLFSTQYLDQGYTYVDARNGFAQLFDLYDDIQDSYDLDPIRVQGDFAVVTGVETLSGRNTYKPGRPWETSTTEFYDVWRYINGNWYLYGDQTSGSGAAAGARKPLRYSPERMKNAVPGEK